MIENSYLNSSIAAISSGRWSYCTKHRTSYNIQFCAISQIYTNQGHVDGIFLFSLPYRTHVFSR